MTLYYRYLPKLFNRLCALRKSHVLVSATRVQKITYDVKINSVFARTICTTNRSLSRFFIDHENSFAHKVMENNELYNRTIAQTRILDSESTLNNETFFNLIREDWEMRSCPEIVNSFKEFSYYARDNKILLSSTEFDNIINVIVKRKTEFSDEQIADILLHTSLYEEEEGINAHNFCNLWEALDATCKSRSTTWDFDQILYFADLWYKLRLVRYSDFVQKNLTRIGRKVKRLTPQQLIQTMFYVNLSRRSLNSMFDFEHNLQSCLHELTINEIAVMSMGFFKTKTPIRSPHLLEHIIYRTVESVDTIDEIALCALAKIIRYSLPITLNEPLSHLLNHLVNQVSRLSILCCVHIALLGTNIQLHNPELIKEIGIKFNNDIDTVRLKDMERLAFAFTMFNFDDGDNNVYYNIINQLKRPEREEELSKHPRAFACCLHYLSFRGLYDADLLNKVLSASFITNAYGKGYFNIGREILFLDASIDVELPNYNGNRLNGVIRQKLAKKLTKDIPIPVANGKYHRSEVLLMEVLESAQNLYGGEKYATGVHILPHFERADILVCLNNNGKPQSVIWQSLYETGAVQTIDKINEYKWIVLAIAAKNQLIFGTCHPSGNLLMKLRQLETLGYIPIVVPWYEWSEVVQDQKGPYLKTKIDSAICEYVNRENCMVRSF